MLKFNDKVFIAERVRYYRKKSDLTQAELAEKVDLSNQHMSKLENGQYMPSLKTFFQLAQVLKMDLREFGYDVQSTQNPIKNQLINKIMSAKDTELIFYNNLIDAVNISLDEVKRDIL